MEIFSPGPVPYPGCYQCPRCNSREVYDSEKTINVSAVTIDVPGPASSTIINSDKVHAKRCRHCNTVAPWLAHPKAVEEANERKAQKLRKTLRIAGVVLGIIVGIAFISNIANGIRDQVESNNFENYRNESNQKLEEVRTDWQSTSASCGLNEEVKLEEVNKDPDYDLGTGPKVDIYLKIPANDYQTFWSTEKGRALDCFSEAIYGAKLSEKLTLTNEQFEDRKKWDLFLFRFYDGVEKDGSIYAQGIIGDEDEHLDGYFDHAQGGVDEFVLSMSWELDKTWFETKNGY
jgi:hypothetical protein